MSEITPPGFLENPECPICLELFEPPCHQCHNGHLICKSCVTKVTKCPVCREKIPIPYIRNIFLDNILQGQKFTCKNPGCEQKFTQKEMEQHLSECSFRCLQFCKILGIDNCSASISRSVVFKHMESFHRFGVIANSQVEIKYDYMEVPYAMEMEPVIIFVLDKIFAVRCVVGLNTVAWFVSANCTSVEAYRFDIKLQLSGSYGTGTVKFEGHPSVNSDNAISRPTLELSRSYFDDKFIQSNILKKGEFRQRKYHVEGTRPTVDSEPEISVLCSSWLNVNVKDLRQTKLPSTEESLAPEENPIPPKVLWSYPWKKL